MLKPSIYRINNIILLVFWNLILYLFFFQLNYSFCFVFFFNYLLLKNTIISMDENTILIALGIVCVFILGGMITKKIIFFDSEEDLWTNIFFFFWGACFVGVFSLYPDLVNYRCTKNIFLAWTNCLWTGCAGLPCKDLYRWHQGKWHYFRYLHVSF